MIIVAKEYYKWRQLDLVSPIRKIYDLENWRIRFSPKRVIHYSAEKVSDTHIKRSRPPVHNFHRVFSPS